MPATDDAFALIKTVPGILKIHALLGVGSFSHVFRCNIEGIEEQVAVKLLGEDVLPGRGREAHFTAGLEHPNLVRLYRIVEGPPDYLVLELCSAGCLHEFLHSPANREILQAISPLQRARAGLDIASALEYLHAREIVHRDIKAGNCFLKEAVIAGENLPPVKVGDLGFARPLTSMGTSMTQGIGTVRYMAPEVIDSGNYGVQADVFSLGILLHELLSGQIPYGKRNEASLILSVMDGGRPRLEAVYPKVVPFGPEVPQIIEVMKACWEQDPDTRPPASEVVERLRAIISTS